MPQKTTFWDLLNKSIIVQSLVTFGLVAVTIYLYAVGKPVPEGLHTMAMTVLAFWMGSKVQYSIDETARQATMSLFAHKEHDHD